MNKPKNILLIDDDEDYLFLTKYSLEKLHMFETVHVVSGGQEALDLITGTCINTQADNCPDVIFVDNHMPGMSGFNFLEKFMHTAGIVKENFKIYMVSSFTNDVDKTKLKQYNIEGFINKPLSAEKLNALFK